MDDAQRREALDRLERALELPLLVLAVVMVPLLVGPIVFRLPPGIEEAFVAADWFIWVVFAVQYVARLFLTPQRLLFLRREWPELLIIVLPFLRPLRVVRSARALRLLRLARVATFFGQATAEMRRLLVRHRLHYALLVAMVVVVGCALFVYAVEEGHGGPIDSFGDSLWWAITTVTTVGYGDAFPITPAGRGIAAFLMVTGIAVFGVLTANLAAFLLHREPEADADHQERGLGSTHAIEQRLDEILRRLDAMERSEVVS